MRILVTGGAGFVGSALCRAFVESGTGAKVTAFDNLRRRGSELNLASFKSLGIDFVHGDIRSQGDLEALAGDFDVLLEASAEPSVHAGTSGGVDYLYATNLQGTFNALEFARRRTGGVLFFSTSRVYSIPAMRAIKLEESGSRFKPSASQELPGLTAKGIAESFPTVGAGFRSLYGTTKLASELLVEEYAVNFKLPCLVNRCGVIAGPGQFGKTDQGVYTLWVARHVFGGKLSYTGFGGRGLQVRDLLHPLDLFGLVQKQLPRLAEGRGEAYAVGGGLEVSTSLAEYTALCQDVSGQKIEIGAQPETAAVDIPWYVTDASRAQRTFGWSPQRKPRDIVTDIHSWLVRDKAILAPLFT